MALQKIPANVIRQYIFRNVTQQKRWIRAKTVARMPAHGLVRVNANSDAKVLPRPRLPQNKNNQNYFPLTGFN